MTYGIPGFKLEKHVVTRRVRRLEEAGIRFHLNFEVGRDSTLEELRNRHDALLIATGVYKSRDMAVPGVGNNGVVKTLDYLIARSEEHTSELQSLMRISYAVFCLKKKKTQNKKIYFMTINKKNKRQKTQTQHT